MKKYLIIILILLFISSSSAFAAWPWHQGMESETVDQAWPYDSVGEVTDDIIDLDGDSGSNCYNFVEDDITPRYESQYLSIYCDWTDYATYVSPYRDDFEIINASLPGTNDNLLSINGSEQWFGWSYYVPSNYYEEGFHSMVAQFYLPTACNPDDSKNRKILNLWMGGGNATADDGHYRIQVYYEGNSHFSNLSPLWTDDKGEWVDWVIHTRLYNSSNASSIFEVYHNGTSVYSVSGLNATVLNGTNTCGPYVQIPMLYLNNITASTVLQNDNTDKFREIHIDEMRMTEGSSGTYEYCDVAPPIWGATPTISYPAQSADNLPTSFTALFDGYNDHHDEGTQNCYTAYQMDIQIDENPADWVGLTFEAANVTSSNQYDISGLAEGTTYDMRVRQCSYNSATSTEYCGDWSDTRTFDTQPPAEVASGNPTSGGGGIAGGGTN